MQDKTKQYLFLVLKIAEFRLEKNQVTEDEFIKLGSVDLLQNFIALLLMDGKEPEIERYIEDDYGLFVASIRSEIRFFKTIGIFRGKPVNKTEEIEISKKVFEKLKQNFQEKWSNERVSTIIKTLYPSNSDPQEEEKVKLNVRVASCMWNSGRYKRGIYEEDIQNEYKLVSKIYKVRWDKYKKHKKKAGYEFPPQNNVVIKQNGKLYIELAKNA